MLQVLLSHEQGHVVGTAQSGVFMGLLLARVFSGELVMWLVGAACTFAQPSSCS